MRMRKKPNLEKRMGLCSELLLEENWRQEQTDFKELWLELGCGKGSFTVKTAGANPDALIVAIEKVESAMVMAMEKAKEEKLANVRFVNGDVRGINELFKEGEASKLFINFPDPWPKSRDAKFRLTSPGFLRRYSLALKEGGELLFRTDNLPLFDWSLEQLEKEGWSLVSVNNDADNEIKTDYETKFFAEGIKINMLCAKKNVNTKSLKDGETERLRNAALSDARLK